MIEAAGHSRRTVKRALQNHSVDLLTEQVNKMVSKGIFEELSDNEILSLGERPHNFSCLIMFLTTNLRALRIE